MTLQQVIETSRQAGLEAERRFGWLVGFNPVSLPDGTILYERDYVRTDGSVSGTGEARIPCDSPEYYRAYHETFRRLAADSSAAEEVCRQIDARAAAAAEREQEAEEVADRWQSAHDAQKRSEVRRCFCGRCYNCQVVFA